MTATHSDPLWTRAFVLLCIVQFLGYAQHFVLQPTIPIYVTHLGVPPFVVGLVMASFAATSLVLRPLVGYWSDRWSEAGVMISGLLIQAASVLLSFVPVVGTTMLTNSCRGVGWVSVNSGGYALLAQCAPAARRGEASGYYSGAQGSATIILPALALWLIDAPFGGFQIVFAVSITIAIIGAGMGMLLKGRGAGGERIRHGAAAGSWWREIFTLPEKDILLASGLLFGLHISLPRPGGLFSPLRAPNWYRTFRLVLRRQWRHEPNRASFARLGIRQNRPWRGDRRRLFARSTSDLCRRECNDTDRHAGLRRALHHDRFSDRRRRNVSARPRARQSRTTPSSDRDLFDGLSAQRGRRFVAYRQRHPARRIFLDVSLRRRAQHPRFDRHVQKLVEPQMTTRNIFFTTKDTKSTKFGVLIIRNLRVLRGEFLIYIRAR